MIPPSGGGGDPRVAAPSLIVRGRSRSRGVLLLALVWMACAPEDDALHLLPVAGQVSREPAASVESAVVLEATVRDRCPGICTELTVRWPDGAQCALRVPGGRLGDRARVVGGTFPPDVGATMIASREDCAQEITGQPGGELR